MKAIKHVGINCVAVRGDDSVVVVCQHKVCARTLESAVGLVALLCRMHFILGDLLDSKCSYRFPHTSPLSNI